MQRHRPFLFLLLPGYHASALASPVSHTRPPPPAHKKPHARIAIRPMPDSPVKPARTRVINTLMAQLGKPYRWGGISPQTGFDCSGLVYYAWRKNFNTRLPRTAVACTAWRRHTQSSFSIWSRAIWSFSP